MDDFTRYLNKQLKDKDFKKEWGVFVRPEQEY